METKLIEANYEHKSVLRNLLELYKYDFSEFDPEDLNEHGRYEYKYLDHYWTEWGRYAFLLRTDGKWSGLALVMRKGEDESGSPMYWMAEFFVLKKYRRSGVGRFAAQELFHRFPGVWTVGQIPENVPAQHFWRGVIGEFTGGRYREVSLPDWEGPVQQFDSSAN